MNSSVCETSSNSRLLGHQCLHSTLWYSSCDKCHNRRRQRKTVITPAKEKIDKNQEYSYQIFTRVGIPKELVPQIFSPTNLHLEKGKRTHYPTSHWALQGEIQEIDMVKILTSLSEIPASLSYPLSRPRTSRVQPVRFVHVGHQLQGRRNVSFILLDSFGWSIN